jgi:uncharacterized coiled-coil DUF342 family protein
VSETQNGRKRNGIYLPWPGVSLLFGLVLAIASPAALIWSTSRELSRELSSLTETVKELKIGLASLNKTVADAKAERAELRGEIREWRKAIESRIAKVETGGR